MICHEHFEAVRTKQLTHEQVHEAAKTCSGCQQAREDERERLQQQAIDPSRPYGQHIGLVCKGCGYEYHTKNISPVGARTIFPSQATSCDCELNLLEVVK